MANKRKCRACGKYGKAEEMFIVPLGAFHTREAASEYGIKNKHKGKAKMEKQKKSESFQEKKARLAVDFDHQVGLTQTKFNIFIRALDKGKPCISCGRMKCGSSIHAGHFKSVGSHFELRFDPRNCYAQGSGCNLSLNKRSGAKNPATISKEYELNLILLFGQSLVDWLNGPHKPKLYSCDDLRELRAIFIAETKRLESGLPPSRNWREL